MFFSYVFGVAVDLLGEAQLYIRVFVILFAIACIFISRPTVSIKLLLIYLLVFIYLVIFFLISQNPITINFIYLTILVFFLQSLKTSHNELLFNSLIASLAVIFLYLIYFTIGDINLGETNINDRTRYSFGFINTNKTGFVAFSLVTLISLYSFKKSSSLIITALLVSPLLIIMAYSGSRTAIYSTIIFFILIFTPFTMALRRVLFLIPPSLLILSLYIATLHNNQLVNNLISFRPIDYYDYVSTLNSINYIFGANTEGFRVDNSYILALVTIGPVGYGFICYFLYQAGKFRPDVYEISFIIALLVYGVLEGVLVRVEFPLILYFYYLIATYYMTPYLTTSKHVHIRTHRY